MRERNPEISRRTASKLLLALPLAAASPVSGSAREDKPSGPAECLAAHEPGLSPEEQGRLRRNIDEGEKGLAVIRAFELPADVAPALKFAALRSRRS